MVSKPSVRGYIPRCLDTSESFGPNSKDQLKVVLGCYGNTDSIRVEVTRSGGVRSGAGLVAPFSSVITSAYIANYFLTCIIYLVL